jgi:DNA-binding transcriptional LysR family regulator
MLDWDDCRYFLAVARCGTLSSSARVVGVTQPTMGRRLEAFEARLGTKLFHRSAAGYALTVSGREMLAQVERMESAALAVEHIATGRDVGLAGTVRVTTTKWFASAIVTPILGALPERHPGLAIEILAQAHWANLARGEADIALRFTRFDQQDIVQRSVARVGFGVYASPRYLERRGPPDFSRGCPDHLIVTMNGDAETASDIRWLRTIAHAAMLSFRSNSRDALAIAAAEGAGLVCLPHHLGTRTPGLVRVALPVAGPDRNVWLGVHRGSRKIPRIRAVTDALIKGLAKAKRALDPPVRTTS